MVFRRLQKIDFTKMAEKEKKKTDLETNTKHNTQFLAKS